tara:strand:+ start:216 stop:896 length:681 start_codon:yes stop_codon:yes gene_type:complete
MKNILCIIPIRSNSKGLKNKNILKFNNKPLVVNTTECAINSKIFKDIVIAYDSEYYKKIIKKYTNHKTLNFFKRSKKSSYAQSPSEIIINEVLDKFKNYDLIYLMQTTSQFTKPYDLVNSLKKFKHSKLDCMFSAYSTKKFFWIKKKNICLPINYNIKKRPMRQKNKKYVCENGAFYIFKKNGFIKYKNRMFGKVGYFEFPEYRSIEIDNLNDLKVAKNILKLNFS